MMLRLGACGLGLFVALAAFAQLGPDADPSVQQGYTNNVFHFSDVDSINLFNGQLTIPVALGPKYQIGPKLSFQAMLSYGSKLWEYGRKFPTSDS